MFRPTSRSVLRAARNSLAPARTIAGRRFISTEPPHLRRRSWKSSAARWGIAIAGLYYYNTSPVFAEQPSNNLVNPNTDALEDNDHSTLETLTARRKRQDQKNTSVLESALQITSEENASQSQMSALADHDQRPAVGSPADLEEEAGQQGAFNEETGEINWDCPCLGGMAHGPCGPQFREAFSCFVFSKEEPKGMDCIEKFKGMQDCFQQYPEIYKGELEDDEELDEEARLELQKEIAARQEAAGNRENDGDIAETAPRRLLEEAGPVSEKVRTEAAGKAQAGVKAVDISSTQPPERKATVQASSEPLPGMSEEHEHIYESQSSPALRTPNLPTTVNKFDEDLELMPKPWHDARDSEEKKPESS